MTPARLTRELTELGKLRALAGALLLTCGAHGAHAEGPRARELAASCAACHGTDGHAVHRAAMAPLAGLSKDFIVLQMQAFRDGTRQATVMQQIAKAYDPDETRALAEYFEQQARSP